MRYILVIITLLCFSSRAFAQHNHSHGDVLALLAAIDEEVAAGKRTFDSGLRQKALLIVAPQSMDESVRPARGTTFKCLTPVTMQLHNAEKNGRLSSQERALLEPAVKMRTGAQTQAVYTSPSGKFEITYETSGADAVPSADANTNGIPDYVEWTGFAADSSWRNMVQNLGYLDPVLNNATFKFTFKNFDFYGVTYPSGATTRIEIHSTFEGFPDNTHPDGNQKGAVYATVGHELKHSIQYMYTNWTGDSEGFLEMDATMYEEVNFDNVNDYYNYLPDAASVIRGPQNSVYAASYEHVTWALFFVEKYGPTFWRQTWQRIGASSSNYFIHVRDNALARGGVIQNDLVENYLYHAAVGDTLNGLGRSLKSYGFEERLTYPLFTGSATITRLNSAVTGQSTAFILNGMSARNIQVTPATSDTGNVYISLSYNKIATAMGVVVERKDRSHRVYFLPAQTGKTFVELRLPERWENARRVIATVANTDVTTNNKTGTAFQVSVQYEISNRTQIPVDNEVQHVRAFELFQNYPNPFNPSTTIRFSLPAAQFVTLEVFDLSGRKIATLASGSYPQGNHAAVWDASEVASGIYVYRLSSASSTLVKRMTLVK